MKNEGDTFFQAKKDYFEKICNELILASVDLYFEVEINFLESHLFDSDAEANVPDKYGCPAYTTEGTWNIAYGVISIYRTGNVVIHKKVFNADALMRAGQLKR